LDTHSYIYGHHVLIEEPFSRRDISTTFQV